MDLLVWLWFRSSLTPLPRGNGELLNRHTSVLSQTDASHRRHARVMAKPCFAWTAGIRPNFKLGWAPASAGVTLKGTQMNEPQH